jgi:hypothetical protein
MIVADRDVPDEHGRCAGQDAARNALFRFRREGRSVRIATPDIEGKDFNDLVLAGGCSDDRCK